MDRRPELLTLPDGGPLPLGYRWLYAHGVLALAPWHLLATQETALGLRAEFLREVAAPNTSAVRDWLPFAQRQDCDEIAGFVLVDGVPTGEVRVVHLTWSQQPEQPGWPSMAPYQDVWDWLVREVIPATHDWANEDDVLDLLAENG